jgi:hypothetical protein
VKSDYDDAPHGGPYDYSQHEDKPMSNGEPYGFWHWMRDNFTEKALLAICAAASVGFGSCNMWLNQKTNDKVEKVEDRQAVIAEKADDAAVKADQAAKVGKEVRSTVNELWLDGAEPAMPKGK